MIDWIIYLMYPIIIGAAYFIFTVYVLKDYVDLAKFVECLWVVIFTMVAVIISNFILTIAIISIIILYALMKFKRREDQKKHHRK